MWRVIDVDFGSNENRNILEILWIESSFDKEFLTKLYDTHEFDNLLKWIFSNLFSQYLPSNVYKLLKDIIFGKIYIWDIPSWLDEKLAREVLVYLQKLDSNRLKSFYLPVSIPTNIRVCWDEKSLARSQESISNTLSSASFLWKIFDKHWTAEHKWEHFISYVKNLCNRVINWISKTKIWEQLIDTLVATR